ncbi:DUF1385 domain-containing protein [Candidatus Woesearchaeota archaeon]|nr:DUF1385 domain-containing protein [Candidatus Woesearchaeota archaeon]
MAIGGQAVINGVMMYNKPYMAVAVRSPKGNVIIKREKIKTVSKNFENIIILRGIIGLIDMLIIGTKSLNFSAYCSMDEKDKKKTKENNFGIAITIIISLVLALFIFKFIPLAIAQLLLSYKIIGSSSAFNIIEGAVKIAIFGSYVYLISFMQDVFVLFQYHGAEHKTVNCYESGMKLTVNNVKKHTTLNERCGTSFILMVLLLSVIIYSFIPTQLGLLVKYSYRLLLLPLITGIAYELIKLSAKYKENLLFKTIIYPGLMFQKITTKEPSNKQIDVAIKALTSVL